MGGYAQGKARKKRKDVLALIGWVLLTFGEEGSVTAKKHEEDFQDTDNCLFFF